MNTDSQLIFRVKSLSNQIRRLMERTALTRNDTNLTGMQFAVLGFLNRRRDVESFQKDVEAEFNVRRSTATVMLQVLEREGFIRRESFTGDARLKRIILTDKAVELGKVARLHILEVQSKLTKDIDPAELERFCGTIEKLIQNAQE